MESNDKLDRLLLDVNSLKLQMDRLVSDAESEKDTRRRSSILFDEMMNGRSGSPGLITRVDRLEQEILRIRENRRHIIALWIAVAAVVIKEIVVWIGGK